MRYSRALVFVLLGCVVFSGIAKAEITSPTTACRPVRLTLASTEPIRILPFGDSITQSDVNHYSWRYPLWKRLVDDGIAVDFVGQETTNYNGNPFWPEYQGQIFDSNHEGHWGAWAEDLDRYMDAWLQYYTPDIALVHAGTNEVLNNATYDAPIRLESIIIRLRWDNPNVIILLAQVIPTGSSSGHGNNGIIWLNAQLPALVEKMTTEESPVYLVDQYSDFNVWTDTWDLIHPNASGEEKMAAKWHAAIRKALAREIPEIHCTSHILGKAQLSGAALIWADANDDGVVDVSDIVLRNQ